MSVNLLQDSSVRFRVFTDDQCDRVVLAALEVLERVGARFFEPTAVETLRRAGAQISDTNRVRFPGGLVRTALNSVPKRFTLYSRTGAPAIQVEPGRAYFGPGPTCCNFIDPVTGERRPFVKNDAALTARVCDALPNIDYVMSLGSISDVPQALADVHEFDAMVRETTKPIMSWSFSRESLDRIYRMCVAVKGAEETTAREPFMIFYAEPSSPLKHSAEAVQKLIYCAQRGIPLVYVPCPIAGATAPATLAGVLVQNLAETLSGVVLSQLIRPGTPMVVGGVQTILDMRTTVMPYGAPELALLSAGATEVARSLGLPMFSTAGCTDSKCLDEQAAIESSLSIVFAALSGAAFVHDVGYTESGMTGSLQHLVMCDEIIGMTGHVVRGIRVDEDTLATEAIAQAVDSNDFLSLDHTARHFREQFWFPRLLDRSRYGDWVDAGGKTLGDRAREMLAHLLAEHRAPALNHGILNSLSGILREAS